MTAPQGVDPEILVVEDDPNDVRLILEALREHAADGRVRVAWNAEDALLLLRRPTVRRPDLVLLDLSLPNESGQEVLAEIKRNPRLLDVPVVVLTASRAPSDVRRSYELQANCYLVKPVDFEQLVALVQAIERFWLSTCARPS